MDLLSLKYYLNVVSGSAIYSKIIIQTKIQNKEHVCHKTQPNELLENLSD